jgi:hypothetical protein
MGSPCSVSNANAVADVFIPTEVKKVLNSLANFLPSLE